MTEHVGGTEEFKFDKCCSKWIAQSGMPVWITEHYREVWLDGYRAAMNDQGCTGYPQIRSTVPTFEAAVAAIAERVAASSNRKEDRE